MGARRTLLKARGVAGLRRKTQRSTFYYCKLGVEPMAVSCPGQAQVGWRGKLCPQRCWSS